MNVVFKNKTDIIFLTMLSFYLSVINNQTFQIQVMNLNAEQTLFTSTE